MLGKLGDQILKIKKLFYLFENTFTGKDISKESEKTGWGKR